MNEDSKQATKYSAAIGGQFLTSTPEHDAESNAKKAGELLKQMREDAEVELATLSSVLKVPERKLQALELGNWQELSNLAIARCLVASICRYLKQDSTEILKQMPQLDDFNGNNSIVTTEDAKPFEWLNNVTKKTKYNLAFKLVPILIILIILVLSYLGTSKKTKDSIVSSMWPVEQANSNEAKLTGSDANAVFEFIPSSNDEKLARQENQQLQAVVPNQTKNARLDFPIPLTTDANANDTSDIKATKKKSGANK